MTFHRQAVILLKVGMTQVILCRCFAIILHLCRAEKRQTNFFSFRLYLTVTTHAGFTASKQTALCLVTGEASSLHFKSLNESLKCLLLNHFCRLI